jgi:hypothetical protein
LSSGSPPSQSSSECSAAAARPAGPVAQLSFLSGALLLLAILGLTLLSGRGWPEYHSRWRPFKNSRPTSHPGLPKPRQHPAKRHRYAPPDTLREQSP